MLTASLSGTDKASVVVGAAAAVVLVTGLLVTRRRPGAVGVRWELGRAFGWALAVIAALHAGVIVLADHDRAVFYQVNQYWPLRIFAARVGLTAWPDVLFLAAGAAVLVVVVRRALRADALGAVELAATSILLTIVLNASQGGAYHGLVSPLGDIDSVYRDAHHVGATTDLLARFDLPSTIEHWASPHVRSHPPGLLLVFTSLRHAEVPLWSIAALFVLLAALAPVAALALFRRLPGISAVGAGRLALLLALTPAVNLYSGTSVEAPALTVALTAWALLLWSDGRRRWFVSALAAGVLATTVCLYSFGGIVIIGLAPFLAVAAGQVTRTRWRSLAVRLVLFALPTVVVVGVLGLAYDYDYVGQLQYLNRHNMPVFWLTTPLLAVVTRLQNVSELLLLGVPAVPGAIVLAVRAWRYDHRRAPGGVVARIITASTTPVGALLVPVAVLVPLLAITPHYGEFARGWLPFFPILLLPLAGLLEDSRTTRWILATAAVWTWLWQAFGNHTW